MMLLSSSVFAEPLIDSWHTADSGRYARIWASQDQEIDERQKGVRSSLKTWDSADYPGVRVGDQPMPVYAGVQGISYSEDYVYIKSTGLATNTMGPWFLNEAQTTDFPSFPGNAAILIVFPAHPATQKTTLRPPALRLTSGPADCSSMAFRFSIQAIPFLTIPQLGEIKNPPTKTVATDIGIAMRSPMKE